jgi:hypothetical protein
VRKLRFKRYAISIAITFFIIFIIIIQQPTTKAQNEPELIIETELRFLFGSGGGNLKITVKGDLAQEIRQDIIQDFGLDINNSNTIIPESVETSYAEAFEDLLELNINPARIGIDLPPDEANVSFDGSFKILKIDRVDIKSIDGLTGTRGDDTSEFHIEMDVKEFHVEDEDVILNDGYVILYALWGEGIPSFHVDVEEKCNIVTIGTNSYSNIRLDSGGKITHYRFLMGDYIEYNHKYELNGYELSNEKKDIVRVDSFNLLENSLVLFILIIIFTIIPSLIASSVTKKNNMKKVKHLRALGAIFFIILVILYLIGLLGLWLLIMNLIYFITNIILVFGIYQMGWGNLAEFTLDRKDFLMKPPKIESGPWHQRGISNAKVGNFDEAINCFEMALESEPENATIWNDLGFVLRKVGNYRTAIDCFNKALEIRPGYQTAMDNLDKAKIELTSMNKRTKKEKRIKR